MVVGIQCVGHVAAGNGMTRLLDNRTVSAKLVWEQKYYLTLSGESTPTFEKSAYIVGIVESDDHIYSRSWRG
ncbi:hypothetical protein NITMOv2_3418 [Nitrospira moscoviensis]|uniref:Uncharacterized protein n=1 Tax=Nitrospira moscoviensis TaxID=42253 RepID=A0A0K2GFR9_NITMO|nr:hypothetical protein NITMOv2_3418 [Nitrospira moscoviensis]